MYDVGLTELVLWIFKGGVGVFLGMVMSVWWIALGMRDSKGAGILTFYFWATFSVGMGIGYAYVLIIHAALWMWFVAIGAYLYAALNGLAGPYDLRR